MVRLIRNVILFSSKLYAQALVLLTGITVASASTSENSSPHIAFTSGEFAIELSTDEPEAIVIAVTALRRDLARILGSAPPTITPGADIRPPRSLAIVNRSTAVHPSLQAGLKTLDGSESHRVYADHSAGRIYLDGKDTRGTIYAIYTFCEQVLRVPPLHFWSSWQPSRRASITVPSDYDIFFPSPQVRYRAVLPGDTDFFTPWRNRDPAHDSIWLETLLRLKMNMVEGYSTVSTGHRMTPYAQMIARHGLALTSHHISGLNTSFATWGNYWRDVRGTEPPALRLANDLAIREFYYYNAETVHRSGVENLWTLAFRGARDQPFWSVFDDAPQDDASRASVINYMMQVQLDTIREVTGEQEPHVRITLYDELADLMAKGLIKPPATRNLILTYVAARRDPYPYDDLVRHDPESGVNVGYYMNFNFASTGAHVVPAEGPWKMEFNYRYAASKGPLAFSVVNVGCVREFLLELSAHAALMWNFDDYSSKTFLEGFCRQYFGADHANAVVELIHDYYHAFWEPKQSTFPGMERQFVFQDLRYARAFDHLERTFTFQQHIVDPNPLRDIGYEREPGRTFRIYPAEMGVANQLEALLLGMELTIPKFEAVAKRASHLMSQLPPDHQRFFNDLLRVPAHYMAHLSRSLYHYVTAYRLQPEPAASASQLDLAMLQLTMAKSYLHETEHGAFAEWYSGAEPMARTFSIEALKRRIRVLSERAQSTY